jgi:hypothetical protein
MGTVEGLLVEGDIVAIISGLAIPVVLSRDVENYRLVGRGYVHRLTNGDYIRLFSKCLALYRHAGGLNSLSSTHQWMG